jgi:hypothetical protein
VRDVTQIHQGQEEFLRKVITEIAITLADDRDNRAWTIEYYLENAKYRLARAIGYADAKKGLKLSHELMPFLRLRDTSLTATLPTHPEPWAWKLSFCRPAP